MRFCAERTWVALSSVLCLALALRLFALWTFTHSIYGPNLMPDEQVYDTWARLLLDGKPVPRVDDFPSAPAHVFAALYRVFGAGADAIRWFNALLGTATCAVMFIVGTQVKDRCVGVLCALLAAVYGPFILCSVTAHSTALGVFVFAGMLAVATRCFARCSALWCLALGAAIAATTWLRPNAVVLGAAAFAWLLLQALHERATLRTFAARLSAFGAGLSLLVLPGPFGGIPEPAFNLYLANTLDNPTPYFRPVRFASAEPGKQAAGFVVEASIRSGRQLTLAEAHDYFIDRLLREWREQPRAAAAKVISKVGASLHPYESANNHNLAFVKRFVSGLAPPYLDFAFIFAWACAGAFFVRNARAAQGLALLAFGYRCTLVLFFADTRVRAPLALALLPFAALGIEALINAVRDRDARRAWRLGLGAALVLATLYALPVPGAGDLSTAYNFHGLFLFDQGDLDRAQAFYRESSALHGSDSASAYLGLAAIAERRFDPAAARRYLSQIPDTHYKAADKYVQLGALLARSRKLGPAADAFERSLQINPGTLAIYPILIALQERLAPDKVEQTKQRYALVASVLATRPPLPAQP